jgi:hypothetical protein
MKYIICAFAVVALSGCATTGFKNTEVLVQKDYVIRTAPDVLKTLPPLPPALQNPKLATNTEIAGFINNTEEYVANLEAMVQTLVNFYEKPVTAAEAGAMRPVTPQAIPTPDASRLIRPQTTATSVTVTKPSIFSSPLQRARQGHE